MALVKDLFQVSPNKDISFQDVIENMIKDESIDWFGVRFASKDIFLDTSKETVGKYTDNKNLYTKSDDLATFSVVYVRYTCSSEKVEEMAE